MMMPASIMIRLLGGETDGGGAALQQISLRFGNDHWMPWLILVTFLSAGLAWWIYRRSPMDLKPGRKIVLVSFRALFFALLGITFLQPMLRLTETRAVPRSLPIAIDHSQSFGIRDLGSETTRFERARQILSDLETAFREELEISTYRFAKDLAAISADTGFEADVSSTAIGDAIAAMRSNHASEPLAGIVILSDGHSNRGQNLENFEEYGVPLYIVGVGVQETVDAAIRELDVPQVVLANDRVPVEIDFHGQGLEGDTGDIVLTLSGVEVARRQVEFTNRPQTLTLEFLPLRAGAYDLEATIETGREEILPANNSIAEQIEVRDARIRVLMVEQAPRWEFKYLQAMLLREPRVRLQCVLFEADAAAAREPGSPYLESFPRREELLNYDLVILGDVDPNFLSETYQQYLLEHVSHAQGSLVIIAGKRFMPSAFRHGAIAPLFPVSLESSGIDQRAASRPVSIVPAVADLPMLILADDFDQNARVWQELPPIYWKAPVTAVKPGAEVLLRTEADDPVAVLQRYGSGEVLFLGTDNVWRWRRNAGDRLHTRFWGQIIQRLAGSRLIESSRQASVRTGRRRYRPGEPIAIEATLRSTDWQPFTQDSVTAILENQDGDRQEILLKAIPGDPGNYAAKAMTDQPGSYRLTIPEAREVPPVNLTVEENNEEFQQLTIDAERLQRLAESTGGRFFTPGNVSGLPAAIENRQATIERTRETAFWASPLYFLILLLPLTAEWILRKFCELK